jgi:DNA-binding response OmpR family regulator
MAAIRILVVEDEPDTQDALRGILVTEGYEVTMVGSGREALVCLANQTSDLIILDLMLPDVSGIEVCQRAREHGYMPIIMLTARRSATDKVRGLTVGADDYIEKPFEPSELLARIAAHLRRVQWMSQSAPLKRRILEIGALRLAPNSYELFLRDELVSVTRLEFDLLYCLAEHAGEVLSREEIANAVWGKGEFIDLRGIDAYVRRLRTKVENDPSRPQRIRTVHGVGYKLTAE